MTNHKLTNILNRKYGFTEIRKFCVYTGIALCQQLDFTIYTGIALCLQLDFTVYTGIALCLQLLRAYLISRNEWLFVRNTLLVYCLLQIKLTNAHIISFHHKSTLRIPLLPHQYTFYFLDFEVHFYSIGATMVFWG